MDYGPWARIILRYGIGYFAGSEAGEALALNPDLQVAAAALMGVVVEAVYAYAKRRGWAT